MGVLSVICRFFDCLRVWHPNPLYCSRVSCIWIPIFSHIPWNWIFKNKIRSLSQLFCSAVFICISFDLFMLIFKICLSINNYFSLLTSYYCILYILIFFSFSALYFCYLTFLHESYYLFVTNEANIFPDVCLQNSLSLGRYILELGKLGFQIWILSVTSYLISNKPPWLTKT